MGSVRKLYHNEKENISVRSSGYLIEKDIDNAKIITLDFLRPDKFSRLQINNVVKLHELYLRNIKLLLPDFRYKNLHVSLVDQQNYKEILKKVKNDYSYLIVGNSFTQPYQIIEPENSGNIKRKMFLQEENSKVCVTQETIDNINKATFAKMVPLGRFLICYKKESKLSKLFKNENSIREFVIEPLRSAWKNIANIKLNFFEKKENINELQIVHPLEMCLHIEFGFEQYADDCLITYPYVYIKPIAKLLN